MNRNSKRLALAACLAACALPQAALAAERDARPPHPPGPPFEVLAERLDLDAAQREAVSRILAQARAAERTARSERRAATRAALAEVLTPEQLAHFDRFPGPRGDRGLPAPPGPAHRSPAPERP
ncbi:MAG: hypothetical protein V2J02_06410 [Pseudomonadales bacterium]|jgi:Spy/CpxP family protein refolding chaperone|nr:hypothetical protein [Pseudomonadales bacterium]